MKALRIIFTIIGIPAFLLGFLMLITGEKSLGLFFLFDGALLILISRLMKPKKNAPAKASPKEETSKSESVLDDPKTQVKTIKVAGISNYLENVMDFAVENDEYEYTKKQIIAENLEDEEIPEYTFMDRPAEFIFEPDNEYDSNAIAIYVATKKIGYVPKERIPFIKDIIDSKRLKSATCEFVGGNYKIYDTDEGEIKKVELNLGARVTVEYTE